MRLFGKRTRQSYKKKENLDTALEQTLVDKAKGDKDWALKQALKRFNLTDEQTDPVIEKKKEIKSKIYSKVFQEIENKPELAEQFEELVLDEIFDQVKTRGHRSRGEPEYYGEGIGSISQALEEVESLTALKEKFQELGMIEGGGQGFLKGMSMKNLLDALPYIAAIMGKGEIPETGQPLRTYVVRVDGQDKELTEPQYKKLLQEGKLQPVAALESPKPAVPEEESTKLPEEITAEVPELPGFLQSTDFIAIEGWLEQEPEDFVINLKGEVDDGIQESRLIWGFLTTATYEGMVEKITPYKDHPEVGNLVQKILSEEGKAWLERVIELVKEQKDE